MINYGFDRCRGGVNITLLRRAPSSIWQYLYIRISKVLQRIRNDGVPSQPCDFTELSSLAHHFKQRDFYRFCRKTAGFLFVRLQVRRFTMLLQVFHALPVLVKHKLQLIIGRLVDIVAYATRFRPCGWTRDKSSCLTVSSILSFAFTSDSTVIRLFFIDCFLS